MEIKKVVEYKTLTVELFGRLDAVAARELDEALKNSLDNMKKLVFDLAKLDYIASAGLRILLKYQKQFNKNDCEMQIKNLSPAVHEVFKMTGYSDFLNVIDNSVKKLSITFQ